jgi:hypothetical protein
MHCLQQNKSSITKLLLLWFLQWSLFFSPFHQFRIFPLCFPSIRISLREREREREIKPDKSITNWQSSQCTFPKCMDLDRLLNYVLAYLAKIAFWPKGLGQKWCEPLLGLVHKNLPFTSCFGGNFVRYWHIGRRNTNPYRLQGTESSAPPTHTAVKRMRNKLYGTIPLKYGDY